MNAPYLQLNNQQIQDVLTLREICSNHDGYRLPIYPHILAQPRIQPSSFLYYENDELIGFIGIYFFYPEGAEISLLVHPEFRKKQIAKHLLSALLPILHLGHLTYVIFSGMPKQMHSWLKKNGFEYVESEFEMKRFLKEKAVIKRPKLDIRKARLADLSDLNYIDSTCFSPEHINEERLALLLENRNYKIVAGQFNGQIVAKAHIHWLKQEAKLSDIAVLPEYQGQGLGKEIIAYCINYALDTRQTPAILDVQTKNHHAIQLYTRLGFELVNQIDFWRVSVNKINQLILNE